MDNKISMQALIGKTDNIYKVVRVASLRAKELNMGGKSLLDKPTSKNYATIALQEIIADKIHVVKKSEVLEQQDNNETQQDKVKNIFKDDNEDGGEETATEDSQE
ncbi:MAG: DNA-directed RNA polymerase subunit omega [Candidatus Aureabacteria bacterium]|nr:DNA-directed RNA polymerase subunit omega [Candidatus Auribacterota bacterium]